MGLPAADILSEACNYILRNGYSPRTRMPNPAAVSVFAVGKRKKLIEIRGRFKEPPTILLLNTDTVYEHCEPVETHQATKAKKVSTPDGITLEAWRERAIAAVRLHINQLLGVEEPTKLDTRTFYEHNQHRLVGKNVRVRGWGAVLVESVLFSLDSEHPIIGFHSPEKGKTYTTFSEITHIQELDY